MTAHDRIKHVDETTLNNFIDWIVAVSQEPHFSPDNAEFYSDKEGIWDGCVFIGNGVTYGDFRKFSAKVDANDPEYLTAEDALKISRTPSEKHRFNRVLDLIRLVAENGKKRALVAFSPDDDADKIIKALERLGYEVERDKNNAYSIQISWQYANESKG